MALVITEMIRKKKESIIVDFQFTEAVFSIKLRYN